MKMKENYTHIAVLLDRSGSMGMIKESVIEGFNTFLKEQKELKDEATMTLAQFNKTYELSYGKTKLSEAPVLTSGNYNLNGTTALNDSLYKLITDTGNDLALLDASERPSKVLIVVITDGQENASTEQTDTSVKALIEHQESKYNWQFVYIGANQDSKVESKSRGMSNSLNFVASNVGIKSMYSTLSASTSTYRSSQKKEKFSI